jgi:hypothetical protein
MMKVGLIRCMQTEDMCPATLNPISSANVRPENKTIRYDTQGRLQTTHNLSH